jgi:hypothetical protein
MATNPSVAMLLRRCCASPMMLVLKMFDEKLRSALFPACVESSLSFLRSGMAQISPFLLFLD